MRLFRATALFAALAALAVHSQAGPDVPAGKYGIAIQPSDGREGYPALGEPTIFFDWDVVEGGQYPAAFGLRVHGSVNLPAPGAGAWQWRVRVKWLKLDGVMESFVFGVFTSEWTGAGVAFWTTFGGVFLETNVFGLPLGNYEVCFALEVSGPGTGGDWVERATCLGYFAW